MKLEKLGRVIGIMALASSLGSLTLYSAIKGENEKADDLLQPSLEETFGSNELFNLPLSDTFSGDGLNFFDDIFNSINEGSEKIAIESDIMRQALSMINQGSIDDAIPLLDQGISEFPQASYPRIVKALLLGSIGELRPAVDILESVVNEDGSNIPALSSLVDFYIRLDDHGSAKGAISKLYQLNPSSPQVHIGLGLIADKEGDILNAIQFYRHGLTLAPSNLVANANLARLYNLTKQYSQTVDLLEELATGDVPSLAIYTTLGVAYLGVNEVEKSLLIHQRAQEKFPEADLSLNFGIVYRQAKRYEDSIDHLKQSISNKPKSLNGYMQLAITYSEIQNFTEAVSVIQKGIEITDSDSVGAYLLLAEVHEKDGKDDKAEAIVQALLTRESTDLSEIDQLNHYYIARDRFEDASKLWGQAQNKFPDNPIVYYRLGQAYKSSGKYQESLNAFSEASRMAPNDLNFKYEMVMVKRELNDIEGALDLTQEIVAAYPERIDFQLILGELYHIAGQDEKSVETYSRILLSDEHSFVALDNLANRYLDLGNLNLAEENARKAYELAPTSGAIMDTLGWILVERGKVDEGRELLEKAHAAGQKDPSIAFHLSKAYQLSGETGKAKALLQSTLAEYRQFPERADAQAALAELAN